MTPLPPGDLYRVTAPHFCAGFVAVRGSVVGAAPILSWAVGKDLPWVLAYLRRKGWAVEALPKRRRARDQLMIWS